MKNKNIASSACHWTDSLSLFFGGQMQKQTLERKMGQPSLGIEIRWTCINTHTHTVVQRRIYKKKIGGEARLVSNGKWKLLTHIFISFDLEFKKKMSIKWESVWNIITADG